MNIETWDFQTALGDTIREKYADQNVKVVEVDGLSLRFKGKFQEACQINWSGGYFRTDGYLRCQHCSCEVCKKHRQEQNLPKCDGNNAPLDQRCSACQRKEIMVKYPRG